MPDLGLAYPTEWGRSPIARAVRLVFQSLVLVPAFRWAATLGVSGAEQIVGPGPFIFTPNHNSHLDTPLTLAALPRTLRRRTVVAAAMDNFFSSQMVSFLTVLFFNGIPVDRHKVNRRSAEIAQGILDKGWNLIIYPEGGRTTTGDLMEFKPGAAYLAEKTGATVIPTYLHDAGYLAGHRYAKADIHRGARTSWRHHVSVCFGEPLRIVEGESMRAFNVRIEAAVAQLGRQVSGDPRYGTLNRGD